MLHRSKGVDRRVINGGHRTMDDGGGLAPTRNDAASSNLGLVRT